MLLFRGMRVEAMDISSDLKSKPYREGTCRTVFLEDLRHLEERGITHADVAEVRAFWKSE